MGLPSSWPIRLIPRHGLRPRQSRPALPDGEESIACGFMNSIGIWDDRCFGAQSLHLRCGSVTRSRWLHSFGYPHYAAFTIEAAASLPQAGLSPTGYSRLFSAHSCFLPTAELHPVPLRAIHGLLQVLFLCVAAEHLELRDLVFEQLVDVVDNRAVGQVPERHH